MVVLVEDGARTPLLVDSTLGQARRVQWPDLPSMLVTETIPAGSRHLFQFNGYSALAATTHRDPARDRVVRMLWFANPRNNIWKGSPDALREDRFLVIEHLVQTLGNRNANWVDSLLASALSEKDDATEH